MKLCGMVCVIGGVLLTCSIRNSQAQAHTGAASGAPGQLIIATTEIVSPVSPMLYGLMTEEINHSYEGGLYAEMVSNNTFHPGWMGTESWGVVRHAGARLKAAVDKVDGPSEALPGSMKVEVTAASPGNEAGVSNAGYWGMVARPATTYRGSFWARVGSADVGPVTVALVDDNTGMAIAKANIDLRSGAWAHYAFTLKTPPGIAVSKTNHLELTVAHPGTLRLQLVSLMPPTFAGRPNGNRIDLTNRMIAMKPTFLRLPGGNYLEGDRLEDWYNWKKTIGPIVDRPGHMAPWTYWSDDQFGLLEFLEWTEDLKVEPVLAVYAGYALKHDFIKPGKDLEPYVQAALDEVEYVTGDVSTRWGAERARNGHPAPFPLHYIEIGNEDEFDKSGSYDGRFAQFARALRTKYPQYKLIATTPVKVTEGPAPDVIDDHYYKSPEDMFALVHKYDAAPRTGPKVFVGEWATRSGSPTPNFGDALGDAAWMTSMERNSDLIVMASYAPLLVNVEPGAMQWPTDLIGFDGRTTYGSPSYYAQCMFGAHLGDATPRSAISGVGEMFFYSATIGSGEKAPQLKSNVLHLKLVNAGTLPQPLTIELKGLDAGAHIAKLTTLHAGSFAATNSIDAPERIKPVEGTARFIGDQLQHVVPPYSIEVVDVLLK